MTVSIADISRFFRVCIRKVSSCRCRRSVPRDVTVIVLSLVKEQFSLKNTAKCCETKYVTVSA
jgi:hypothetical protein